MKKHPKPTHPLPTPVTGPQQRAPGTATPATNLDAVPTPPLPAIVVEAFQRLNLRQRARMLGRLLASAGPLAIAAVGGGAFAKYVVHARWPEVPVTIEDAARATSAQVYELVRYVEQSNPQLFAQLLDALARNPATIAALSASVAALTMNRLATRNTPPANKV